MVRNCLFFLSPLDFKLCVSVKLQPAAWTCCAVSTCCWGQQSCVHPAVLLCCVALCFPPCWPLSAFTTAFLPLLLQPHFPFSSQCPSGCVCLVCSFFFLVSSSGISIRLCGSSSTKASRGLFVFYFQPTLKNNSFVS